MGVESCTGLGLLFLSSFWQLRLVRTGATQQTWGFGQGFTMVFQDHENIFLSILGPSPIATYLVQLVSFRSELILE